ncbi:MAG: M28 family metallopeptidase [Sarcina sp.]
MRRRKKLSYYFIGVFIFSILFISSFIISFYSKVLIDFPNKQDEKFILENIRKESTSSSNDDVVEEKINIPTMEEIVEKLCSGDFEGRLSGDFGNKFSEKYIEDIFQNLDLIPVFSEDYRNFYNYNQKIKPGELLSKEEKELFKRSIDGEELKIEGNNIVGKIEGKNNKKAVVISAHFDHIGRKDNRIIRGAVDNASGVATMIAIAEDLKAKNQFIDFEDDIIFVAFNGEELGLVGSSYFVKDLSKLYDDFYNINLDCIGYKDGEKIVLSNSYNKTKKIRGDNNYLQLAKELRETLEKNNLKVTYKDSSFGVSDDYSFQRAGFKSILISQEDISKVIHKVEDNPEVIDYGQLEMIKKSVVDFLVKR